MSNLIDNKKQDEDERETPLSSSTTEPPSTTASTTDTGRKKSLHEKQEKPAIGTTVFLHGAGGDGRLVRARDYLRSSGIVFRAMHLLEDWKFLTARISSAKVPVDIIALRQDMALLVQVISSKRSLPDARTIIRHYATKIESLRSMGTSAQFRKMLMAYSGLCGWKYYEVLPGGLIPAWSLPVPPVT